MEQLCKDYPEIATELGLLQNGLKYYAVKKTTWNKDALKKKIWDRIDKMNNEEKNT